MSKTSTLLPHGNRIENFVDVGDPGAPIGSPAWCKASHLQLCATKKQADLDVRHLKFGLVEFREKERWKHLTNDKHKPFRSWEEYLTYQEPFGLGIPIESAQRVMEAVDGELIGEVLGKQGRPKKGEEKPSNRRIKYGDNPEYIEARLERDGKTDPRKAELLAKARNGEMSWTAAGHEAGLFTKLTPFKQIEKLIGKYLKLKQLTDDERAELRQMLR